MKKILEIKNLDKSFGGVHAINDLSFDIYEGEILGLIGPNGCGKSTTVNLITGVYIQDSGEILFDGKSLKKELVPDRAAMGLARTFQTPKPFSNMTVFDSVYTVCMLYNKSMKAAAKRAWELLELTGFTDSADVLCSKLPIEKRKWLDMTRALATNPKILMLDECLAGLTPSEIESSIEMVKKINATGITILDEPSLGLAPIVVDEVFRILEDLKAKGTSMLIIEQNLVKALNVSDRGYVLENGRVALTGDSKELLKNPEVRKAYLGVE